MIKAITWLLSVQKFLFGFAVIFGAIPITYTIADLIFDNNILIFLLGIILYIICVIPLAYSLGVGYDKLIQRVSRKEEVSSKNSTVSQKETDLSVKVQEDDTELTVIETQR